jgi:hypothetical protein
LLTAFPSERKIRVRSNVYVVSEPIPISQLEQLSRELFYGEEPGYGVAGYIVDEDQTNIVSKLK